VSTLEELRDRIRRHAAAATNELEDDLLEVLDTITRLEGERDAARNDYQRRNLEAIFSEARAEAAEATLAEATSATMMAEMRADKLATENARLREVVAELERQMEHTFPLEWVDVPREPKVSPTSQET
jgi:chromosome segregation ATPase